MYGKSGRTAYTQSVLSIIQDVLSEQSASSPHTGSSPPSPPSRGGESHKYCPQAQYANGLKARQTGYPTYHHTVKDSNRFKAFNTNQGNM